MQGYVSADFLVNFEKEKEVAYCALFSGGFWHVTMIEQSHSIFFSWRFYTDVESDTNALVCWWVC
jgi:hypothetical protein